jgi:hypothetical protein
VGVPEPVTVAVKVTAWPRLLGFCDDVRVVLEPSAPVTVIAFDVPVIAGVAVSEAVMVREPGVFSVAENVPTPLVNVEFAGKTAAPSLLVK